MGLRKRQLKVSLRHAARGAENKPPPQIDVDPGELDVFGSVEVTFALEG
jgi:hypothetical protein